MLEFKIFANVSVCKERNGADTTNPSQHNNLYGRFKAAIRKLNSFFYLHTCWRKFYFFSPSPVLSLACTGLVGKITTPYPFPLLKHYPSLDNKTVSLLLQMCFDGIKKEKAIDILTQTITLLEKENDIIKFRQWGSPQVFLPDLDDKANLCAHRIQILKYLIDEAYSQLENLDTVQQERSCRGKDIEEPSNSQVVQVPNCKMVTMVFHNNKSVFCSPELIYEAVKKFADTEFVKTKPLFD